MFCTYEVIIEQDIVPISPSMEIIQTPFAIFLGRPRSFNISLIGYKLLWRETEIQSKQRNTTVIQSSYYADI